MALLNIQHGNQAQQIRYEYDSGIYTFESDIQIGSWKVSRFIKIGGKTGGSIYKYDFKRFFEFVVTDVNGVCQVLTWNHNDGDKALEAYWGDSAVDALPFFFANHPIFFAKDWEDYKSMRTINDINEILKDNELSADGKIKAIKKLISEAQ